MGLPFRLVIDSRQPYRKGVAPWCSILLARTRFLLFADTFRRRNDRLCSETIVARGRRGLLFLLLLFPRSGSENAFRARVAGAKFRKRIARTGPPAAHSAPASAEHRSARGICSRRQLGE